MLIRFPSALPSLVTGIRVGAVFAPIGAVIGEPLVAGAVANEEVIAVTAAQQIGAAIAEQRLDALVFFWDPLQPQPHDPDVKALLRIAVVWNVPVACDRATADFIISSPLMHTKYERLVPDYEAYAKRKLAVEVKPAPFEGRLTASFADVLRARP